MTSLVLMLSTPMVEAGYNVVARYDADITDCNEPEWVGRLVSEVFSAMAAAAVRTPEVIERAARALCVADGCDPEEDWTKAGPVMLDVVLRDGERQRWRTYIPKARVVIQAIHGAA